MGVGAKRIHPSVYTNRRKKKLDEINMKIISEFWANSNLVEHILFMYLCRCTHKNFVVLATLRQIILIIAIIYLTTTFMFDGRTFVLTIYTPFGGETVLSWTKPVFFEIYSIRRSFKVLSDDDDETNKFILITPLLTCR